MQIDVHSGVHQRVFHAINILDDHLGLSVGTHDDFVPVGVDMALTKRHRLRKNVIARAEQVNEEDFVVLDQAEDAFVVVACALRAKRDDDAL